MSIIRMDFFTTHTGKQPFVDWQDSLDETIQTLVDARITRVRLGNFGDCTPIKGGNGIWELRIDVGPGWRIYFGKQGLTMVMLLMGGDKKSQTKDIIKAKKYWLQHKESKNG